MKITDKLIRISKLVGAVNAALQAFVKYVKQDDYDQIDK